jgi:hypothetical protein
MAASQPRQPRLVVIAILLLTGLADPVISVQHP